MLIYPTIRTRSHLELIHNIIHNLITFSSFGSRMLLSPVCSESFESSMNSFRTLLGWQRSRHCGHVFWWASH